MKSKVFQLGLIPKGFSLVFRFPTIVFDGFWVSSCAVRIGNNKKCPKQREILRFFLQKVKIQLGFSPHKLSWQN